MEFAVPEGTMEALMQAIFISIVLIYHRATVLDVKSEKEKKYPLVEDCARVDDRGS